MTGSSSRRTSILGRQARQSDGAKSRDAERSGFADPRPRGGTHTGLLWGLLALALYVATCAPGVGWQDSGIHQHRILTRQLEHPRGLALSHPVHYWLGRAALVLPLGEPAHRLNLLSALFGAVGVGLAAGIVANLTRSWVAASFAALAMLFSHSYWQMSVVTEVYAVAAGFMTLEWCLLLWYTRARRPVLLVLLFAVNGLHCGAHQFGLLTLVTYVVVILERIYRRKLAPAWLLGLILAWMLAALPSGLMALGYYQRSGDLAATLRSMFFGGHGGRGGWADSVLSTRLTLAQVGSALLSFGYCFPSLVVPVALLGLFRPARRRGRVFRLVLIAQTVLIGGFVARYKVPDLYTFFVPVCALVGVWYGIGADRLIRTLRGRPAQRWLYGVLVVNALLPLAVYVWFPVVARDRQLVSSRLRDLPYRDEYTYFFRPWRCTDSSAALFARDALERTGPGGWLLADSTTGPTTAYSYLVHGGPGDVRVYSERTWLGHPDSPELSDEELAAFIRAGGRVVVVPGVAADKTWGQRFKFDKTAGEFWYIQAD